MKCVLCVFISFNSLAPGRSEWNFRYVIFKWILVIDGWGISYEISLKWMSLDFTDDESTLVKVMAWCHQATSHYLSQCWPRSLSPYGVTRPQWVKWLHYIDVTWGSWCLKSPSTVLFSPNIDYKGNIKAPHYWPFVRVIYQSPAVFRHIGPVLQKVSPYHDVIMLPYWTL